MNLGLENKVFVVSGGGSGIGAAIALGAMQEGARVVILGREDITHTPVEEQFLATGRDFLSVKTELSDPLQCRHAVEKAVQKYGKIKKNRCVGQQCRCQRRHRARRRIPRRVCTVHAQKPVSLLLSVPLCPATPKAFQGKHH